MCLLLLSAVYAAAIWTSAGQGFEDAVLRRASDGPALGWQLTLANLLLSTISNTTLLVWMATVAAIGYLRKRTTVGLVGVAIIVASVLTTQLLQSLAHRPILLEHGYRREDQSFPSGHTAIATSVLAALVLVVPLRFRRPVAVVCGPFAIGVGVAAVTAGWHRPSDILGSDLIVLMYSAAAIALLAKMRAVEPAGDRKPVANVFSGPGAVGAVLVGAVLVVPRTTTSDEVAFATGRSIAILAGVALTLTVLALVRGVEFHEPRSRNHAS